MLGLPCAITNMVDRENSTKEPKPSEVDTSTDNVIDIDYFSSFKSLAIKGDGIHHDTRVQACIKGVTILDNYGASFYSHAEPLSK